MDETRIEVAEEAVSERLDRYLATRLGVSRARVRHLLEVGRIQIGGRSLALSDKSRKVAASETYVISGQLLAEAEVPTAREDLPCEVVAEERGWLVVNKPANCGVHPLRPDQQDTVLNAVCARHPEIVGVGESGLRSGVVHRLDVDTTGVLLFATDEPTWKRLRGAFTEHRVRKTYHALVAGRFESAQRVDLKLEVKRHQPAHVGVVTEGGHRCRQRIEPEQVFEEATQVRVHLETGFLHQIRAILAHLGHPLLGDTEYGGPSTFAGETIARPMLHASRITVDEINASVAPPSDFAAVLAKLGE